MFHPHFHWLCGLEVKLLLKLLISFMLTRMKGNTFQISPQYFLFLTHQDFNEFRQENWIRMIKEGTIQTPSTTKPFLSNISGTILASLPYYIELFGESVCESAEENLLHLDELKSPPSPFFNLLQIPFNFQSPARLLFPINPGKDFV